MKNDQKECREAFEKWKISKFGPSTFLDKEVGRTDYASPETQIMWVSWQAAWNHSPIPQPSTDRVKAAVRAIDDLILMNAPFEVPLEQIAKTALSAADAVTISCDDEGRPKRIDPDMPVQQLLLHFGELTRSEILLARAAIRFANSFMSTSSKFNTIKPLSNHRKDEE